jgi:integrase
VSKRGAGEGSIYKQGVDGRWCGVLSLGGGRRKKFYGKTRPEVARKLTQALKAYHDGVAPPPERQTVGDFLTLWLRDTASTNVRPSTFRSYESIIRLHLLPTVGKTPLARLTPSHVQDLINRKLAEGLSPRRVEYIRAVLRHALNQALRWGLVARNVATLVEAPRAQHTEIRPLEASEIPQFLDAIHGDRLEGVYILALAVGLRQGEALGLVWQDIDFEGRTLTVSRALQRLDGQFHFVEPKTRLSRRVIHLPLTAIGALEAHRGRQGLEQLAMGAHRQDLGLVFSTVEGRPLDASYVTHHFQSLLAKAGLRRQRFHDLRHACARLLLAQGVPARVVMDVLGHSQVSLTLNTYSHVVPSLRTDAAERMDAVLARALAATGKQTTSALNLALKPGPEPTAGLLETQDSSSERGTRYRTRTCDQGIKSPLLYQLS